MKIEKNQINKKISILNENNEVELELYFIPSFFIFSFHTKNTIIISQTIDEVFYHNLNWLMNNFYYFSHQHSMKTQNELIWLSEQCYDIESKEECDSTSRLVIKKINNEFHISYRNPFFEKYNIKRNGIVSFSPAGNGFLNNNIDTNSSLQDDIIKLFYSTLNEEKIKHDKILKR